MAAPPLCVFFANHFDYGSPGVGWREDIERFRPHLRIAHAQTDHFGLISGARPGGFPAPPGITPAYRKVWYRTNRIASVRSGLPPSLAEGFFRQTLKKQFDCFDRFTVPSLYCPDHRAVFVAHP